VAVFDNVCGQVEQELLFEPFPCFAAEMFGCYL
jgi:hypothetical protein